MFKHLLVPTDGSELSQKSSQNAVIFAKEINAKITGLYVKPDYPLFYFGEAVAIDHQAIDDFTQIANKQAKEYLEYIKNLCEENKIKYSSEISEGGNIYEEIINTAEKNKCDLIYMASHGRGGISGFLLGSETQKVLTHSKIPILVYR